MSVMKSQKTPLQQLLRLLVQSPDLFTAELTYAALHDILTGQASPSQIASFLTSLRAHRLDHRADIIAACGRVLVAQAIPVPLSDYALSPEDIVDIVGTGGDGHDTFNVSTLLHGNRASSSRSGSADMLEALGYPIGTHTLLIPYHPAVAHVASIRKELGFPTVFNLLGPLINPARPKRTVVGVAAKELGPIMLDALRLGGVEEALVVCGEEGLDEISPAGNTNVWRLSNGQVTHFTLHPSDFGLESHSLEEVRGGDGRQNAVILKEIFNGQRQDAILDFILMNASALLVVAGKAKDWKEGVLLAREAISSGRAKETLAQLVATTT
ncbi:glycosyl transferase [Syncephalis plumigaleata]|nr:glycosyl transferase [Syncephalis plumigaleata]